MRSSDPVQLSHPLLPVATLHAVAPDKRDWAFIQMPAKLHLSKLDVALRQLETAVTLYFHHADPVSIHTLTAAAYNVLRNIKNHRSEDFTMFKDAQQIYPEMRKEFRNLLNEAENFFKRADRDPEGTFAFAPDLSDVLLIDACEAYGRLTGERRPLLTLYMTWFRIRHPQYYDATAAVDELSKSYQEADRLLYFRECL